VLPEPCDIPGVILRDLALPLTFGAGTSTMNVYVSANARLSESAGTSPNKIKLRDVYLRRTGRRAGQDIWIVDGARVRRDIFDEFLQGGNDQRYRFVPRNEIWIDGSTSVEEYTYALMHELHERNQMLTKGMTYDRAHREALMLELGARRKNLIDSNAHELKLPHMPPMDSEGNQEIEDIGDKVPLRDIYRARLPERRGLQVWVVDGAIVRRDLFPDFGFAGNDLYYQFIPRREIWIDDQVNCAEMDYQIIHQLRERASMARGADAQTAYGIGSALQIAARRRDAQMVVRKEERLAPVTLGTRDKGTKQSLRQSRSNRNR